MASNENHEWSAKQNTLQVKDHFIFTVESVGALSPGTLVGMVGIFLKPCYIVIMPPSGWHDRYLLR